MSKNGKLGKIILAGLASQMLFAAPIQASTLDELNKQEQEKTSEISNLENEIGSMLFSINERKAEIDNLNAEVAEIELEKQQTVSEIEEQKELIAARKEQLEERLIALQTSPSSNNRIMMVLEAENFSDFIGKFLLVSQLQAADNERIEAAIEEEEKLSQLEERLVEEIALGKSKAELVSIESESLHQELGNLQAVLADNQVALQEILTSKSEEEQRLAEVARQEQEAAEKAEAERLAAEEAEKQAELEKQEAAVLAAKQEAAKVEQTVSKEEVVNTTPSGTSNETTPAKKEEPVKETTPPASTGRTLTVEATAYSRNEPGLTNFTATGIDLRSNPMVIAVDPSVIPLGTLLDVPGYGIAIAGDTGSAIKGNKIDLHMENLAACHAFGRQTITITILD